MKKSIFPALVSALPSVAYAVATNVQGAIVIVSDFLGRVVQLLIAVAVLIVFWGLAQFVLHADEESAREHYKKFMLWGVIAIFLIVSFWGLVGMITSSVFGGSV